ncbi:ParA family protein [Natrarchaeobius halalkaliphilus]|uniref:ParA family protein n=2 Tax=Natrarchaeobius halalkaliphilus TaxID=1679091 RepID=A0A3N6P3U9_9EURY|nr:ParA family protein [Natrarchaeobius halalkaliphilus]RQG90025.1 ParA family protein [Natrarchaeobius halalkaliphilus]
MRGITVTLQKGGVGKTTVAINLAERLATRDNDVLLVDVDPQGSATEGVGCGDAYTAERSLRHVLERTDPLDPGALCRPVAGDTRFDLLPSNAELQHVSRRIYGDDSGELLFYRRIVKPLADEYDWVVFDAPPTIGPLSNAALIATRQVVLPLQLSKPSADALIRTVTNQLFSLNDRLSDPIDILSIVPNRVKGDNEEKRVLEAIEDSQFEPYLPSFSRSDRLETSPGPGIRERIAFRRAYRDGVPLSTYDPNADMLERFETLAAIVENRSTESV